MNQHLTRNPTGPLSNVEVFQLGGAWFVSFEDEAGARVWLQKQNGRRKGFRSLDTLFGYLVWEQGVQRFSVQAEPVPKYGVP